METIDYKDLLEVPDAARAANSTLARNASHLARVLRSHPYPHES